ncbi:hypothetical protein [Rhizosaccharibacter radicis]|uniref:Uncharacterized protein n=1 Tax=Rhizosaccharibacter radicis TaxID=2782605 RepID=A0ABT1VVY3_9PROT|nr:hypothetical protein [Acetobacteraceae bacterium KSS12]
MSRALNLAVALALISGTAKAGSFGGGGFAVPSSGMTTPQITQLNTASSSAATALAASQAALPKTGGTMTGAIGTQQVNLNPGYSIVVWNGGAGSVGWQGEGGGTAGRTAITMSPYMYGYANSASLAQIQAIDGVRDTSAGGTLLHVSDYLDNYAMGNRNVVEGDLFISKTPAFGGAYAGVLGQATSNAPMPVDYGEMGAPIHVGGSQPQMQGLYGYVRANANGIWEMDNEIDTLTASNAGVGELHGLMLGVGVDGIACSPVFGTCYPGLTDNAGISMFGTLDHAYAVNKRTGDWALPTDTTLFGSYFKEYGGAASITPSAYYGVDLRRIAFSQSPFASNGFGVDGGGNIGAVSANVGSAGINGVTSTLGSIAVHQAGDYTAFPTLTVDAPQQSGGTQATASVSGMQAKTVHGFSSTGKSYKAGDVLSIGGVTGTSATFTVGSVDGNGGITGFSSSTPGTMTGIPNTSMVTLTGGSGTGASIMVNWTQGSATGTFGATFNVFSSTGSGYAVNDTVTLSGDTGTAAAFKVTKVSATGGIMLDPTLVPITGMTVASTGTVTAIGGSNGYHGVTGGSGTGASLQVGYGIASVAVGNPGAGYLPQPLPWVIASQGYQMAWLVPTMSTAGATLNLGTAGQTVNSRGAPTTAASTSGVTVPQGSTQAWNTPSTAPSGAGAFINAHSGGYGGFQFFDMAPGMWSSSNTPIFSIGPQGDLQMGLGKSLYLQNTVGNSTALCYLNMSTTQQINCADSQAESWLLGTTTVKSLLNQGIEVIGGGSQSGSNTLTVNGSAAVTGTFVPGSIASYSFGVAGGTMYQGVMEGIATAGTTLATATKLTNRFNTVSTCSLGGVSLPAAYPVGAMTTVFNRCGAALTVYPDTASTQIESSAAGASVSVASGASATWVKMSNTLWRQQ